MPLPAKLNSKVPLLVDPTYKQVLADRKRYALRPRGEPFNSRLNVPLLAWDFTDPLCVAVSPAGVTDRLGAIGARFENKNMALITVGSVADIHGRGRFFREQFRRP